MLEWALCINAIEQGDILVLDELEINMYSKGQIEYARTLANLQKMFEFKIIITTHNLYFMCAIESFTDVTNTMDTLNVLDKVREEKE